STSWATTRSSRRTRVPLVQIRFDAATCRACQLRPRCTTAGSGKWGRALTLREPAQRAALQQRRREQDTDAWRARYRPRAGIEATVCQIVHPTHAAAATEPPQPPTSATASQPPPSTSSASMPGSKATAPSAPAPPTYAVCSPNPRNERSATGSFRRVEKVKLSASRIPEARYHAKLISSQGLVLPGSPAASAAGLPGLMVECEQGAWCQSSPSIRSMLLSTASSSPRAASTSSARLLRKSSMMTSCSARTAS
ncbi:transposase, partial [Streptomyces sp. TRM68367]|nr:transposase [Streptomyces sp. TRM68367]